MGDEEEVEIEEEGRGKDVLERWTEGSRAQEGEVWVWKGLWVEAWKCGDVEKGT